MSDAPLGLGKGVCFIVSPIGENDSATRRRADQLIRFLVKPALGDIYTIVRADQITTPGSINRQVFEHLLKDDLVVADLSDHNPNVFYELAVRHAFAKPYVQMIHAGDKIPFDLVDQRTIKFDLADLESVDNAKFALRELAIATRDPRFRVVTPIGEAAGMIAALEDAPNPIRKVIDVVENRFTVLDEKVLELAAEVATLRSWLHNRAHLEKPKTLPIPKRLRDQPTTEESPYSSEAEPTEDITSSETPTLLVSRSKRRRRKGAKTSTR